LLGRYSINSWLTTSTGNFNISLVDVNAKGFCGLTVDPEGILQATNISLDLGFYDIKMKFENLGFFANVLQVISAAMKILKKSFYQREIRFRSSI